MKAIYIIITVALLAPLTWSCQPEITTLPEFEAMIVVDGSIEDGQVATVILTQVIPSESTLDSTLLSQIPIRWGKITLTCEDEEEIMVGGRDTSYLFQFYYRSLHLKGEAGKTYSIKVEYNEVVATATTTIPEPVDLIEIRAEKVTDSDSSYVIMAKLNEPSQEGNHYLVSTKIEGIDYIYKPTLMGVWSDTRINQMDNEIPIYRALSISQTGKEFGVFYTSGDIVWVKISHIDEISYNYWLSQQELFINNSNPIYPVTENAQTNIEGGLGCWSGLGSVIYKIEIP
ncbi:MAG: DUF4249 domain-containing protein [Rikenellaceae bacterium]